MTPAIEVITAGPNDGIRAGSESIIRHCTLRRSDGGFLSGDNCDQNSCAGMLTYGFAGGCAHPLRTTSITPL